MFDLKGNLTGNEAKAIDSTVRRFLSPNPLPESASTELRCLKIAEGTHFLQVRCIYLYSARYFYSNPTLSCIYFTRTSSKNEYLNTEFEFLYWHKTWNYKQLSIFFNNPQQFSCLSSIFLFQSHTFSFLAFFSILSLYIFLSHFRFLIIFCSFWFLLFLFHYFSFFL